MIVIKVTPDQYTKLASQLKQEAGLELAGNTGTIQKEGITASYSYDGTSNLRIDVVSKPFLISKAAVEGHLRQTLTEHGYLVI